MTRQTILRKPAILSFCSAIAAAIYFGIAAAEPPSRRILDLHEARISGLGYLQCGKTLVTSYGNGTIKFWDAKSGAQLPLVLQAGGEIDTLLTASRGTVVAAARHQVMPDWRFLKFWDFSTGKQLVREDMPPAIVLALSADGRTLVTSQGADGNSTDVWDVATGDHIVRLTGRCDNLVFTNDGKTLASYRLGLHNGIHLWSTRTWYEDGRYGVHGGNFAVSSDKRWIAHIGNLDDRDHRHSYTLEPKAGSLSCVAFTPDDKYLIGAWGDNVFVRGQPPKSGIFIWDVGGRKMQAKKSVVGQVIAHLAVSPEGTQFATAGEDATWEHGSVKLWPLPLKD